MLSAAASVAESSANENCARTTRSEPTRGSSSTSRSACGWWRHMNASASTRPAASAASKARSTASTERASGFSHSTCLPASSARIDHSTCMELGSEM